MKFFKFNHTRFIFICLFLIIKFDHLNSQIRFPDENNGYVRPVDNNNVNYNRKCMSYRYIPGNCVPLYQCGELRYSRDFNILRRSLCGFEGNDPKVCCPTQTGGNPYNPNPYNPNPYNPNPYPTPNQPYPTPNQPNDYTTPSTNYPDNINSNNLDFRYPSRLPQTCGGAVGFSDKIVGGSPAKPGAWPWMTSLQYGRAGSRSHLCGAALVSHNLVITASHCLKNDDDSTTKASMLSVKFGEHNIEEDSAEDAAQEYEIAEVITHPNYTKTFKYDIAVLRLKNSVQFNNRISPICLPYDSELIRTKSLTGRSAMITGWGATSYNGASSPTLLQASLKIVNQNFCKNAFQKWLVITEEYICAASSGFDKDSCQGDSGGPLVMFDNDKKRWYLIGVVSFGKKCASKDTPGVYTRLSSPSILQWLTKYF